MLTAMRPVARSALALAAACHPEPTVAVTAMATALAATTGRDAVGVLLVAVAVLTGQLSIGWLNDYLDADRDVLVVEDIIDSGLTLSWLLKNLSGRGPKSLEVITLLRKPEVQTAKIDLLDVGFDIPNEFVIGYGLDYAERYRDLPYVGTLHPRVYSEGQ